MLSDYELLKQFLEEFPECTGASFGFTSTDGVIEDNENDRFLIAHVEQKGRVKSKEIPLSWRGYSTDVIESVPGNKPDRNPFESIGTESMNGSQVQPGQSIGNLTSPGAGTLGMVVWDKLGSPHIVTNHHVIPDKSGTIVTQPAPWESHQRNEIGSKIWSTDQGVDVCVVRLENQFKDPDGSTNIPVSLSAEIRGHSAPFVGQILHKVGRTTGYTTAKVVAVGMLQFSEGAGKPPRYVYAATIVPLEELNPQDIEISSSGDSGAIWFNDSMEAVALHFAGDISQKPEHERAYACPMDVVMQTGMLKNFTTISPVALGINTRQIQIRIHAMRSTIQTQQTALKTVLEGLDQIESEIIK